jgi:hypothetical protein
MEDRRRKSDTKRKRRAGIGQREVFRLRVMPTEAEISPRCRELGTHRKEQDASAALDARGQ